MVDLTPIEKYISDETLQHSQQAAFEINRIGFDTWFEVQIDTFCNCTKTFSDGRRVTQTNDKRYNYELTTAVQMIELFGEDKKDYYYEILLKQHNANIEYEAINGFEYNPNSKDNKKKSTSTPRKKNKQLSIEGVEKPKKETAAERKIKAHAIKLNALTFKPKTAENGNTL